MPNLIDQRRTALASARKIVDAAKAQNRDNMTSDEVKTINDYLADVDELDVKIKAAKDSQAVLSRLGLVQPGVIQPASDDIGAAGFGPQLKTLHAAARAGQSVSVEIDRKAFVAVALPPVITGTLIPGDYAGLSPRLLDLFSQVTAAGPVVRQYRVSTPGTAGIVAEGELKPDSGIQVEPVDVAMTKIAATCKISDEASEDLPTFASALMQELGMAVLDRENLYAITTVLATSGIQTATSDNAIDGVADAISQLSTTFGVQADAVALSPADLAAVRKAKASTAGVYQADPFVAGPPSLHGLPVVVTTRLDPGTALVGSFKSAGSAFTRTALRVDLGFSVDDFQRNLRTARAEERVALGLTRPSHLVELTITTP